MGDKLVMVGVVAAADHFDDAAHSNKRRNARCHLSFIVHAVLISVIPLGSVELSWILYRRPAPEDK